MRVGIVGSEAAKFTPDTEAKARECIRSVLRHRSVTCVVSGECHLGGVDIFAREEAEAMGLEFIPHPPKTQRWHDGYKPRNLAIAQDSDMLLCITVRELPATYEGMRFKGCYHCGTPPEHHVKSGGCWTMKEAAKLGKRTKLVVVSEGE